MEPTIYKPSIYNGAGVYNTGAEGGGNSGNGFPFYTNFTNYDGRFDTPQKGNIYRLTQDYLTITKDSTTYNGETINGIKIVQRSGKEGVTSSYYIQTYFGSFYYNKKFNADFYFKGSSTSSYLYLCTQFINQSYDVYISYNESEMRLAISQSVAIANIDPVGVTYRGDVSGVHSYKFNDTENIIHIIAEYDVINNKLILYKDSKNNRVVTINMPLPSEGFFSGITISPRSTTNGLFLYELKYY